MTAEAILFFLFAGLAVVGALNLVLQRHPIHSALSLILVMVSLAVLYLLLGAEFIAAIQIIVYAGAIMVLFVFVIMLLNAGEEEHTNWSRMARYFGLPVAAVLLLELGWLLYRSWPGDTLVQSDRMVGRTAASASCFQTTCCRSSSPNPHSGRHPRRRRPRQEGARR
jgi:NADH-quinone oxidoreductase subunit J